MPKDIVITSDIDPCSHGQDTDQQKRADGRMDGQMAFQLYIVDHRCSIVFTPFYFMQLFIGNLMQLES